MGTHVDPAHGAQATCFRRGRGTAAMKDVPAAEHHNILPRLTNVEANGASFARCDQFDRRAGIDRGRVAHRRLPARAPRKQLLVSGFFGGELTSCADVVHHLPLAQRARATARGASRVARVAQVVPGCRTRALALVAQRRQVSRQVSVGGGHGPGTNFKFEKVDHPPSKKTKPTSCRPSASQSSRPSARTSVSRRRATRRR